MSAPEIATALGIGATLITAFMWVLKAVIAKEVTPPLTAVANEAKSLANALRETKEDAAQDRAETHRILGKLTDMVANIDGRVIRLEERSGAQRKFPGDPHV